jgi:AsmA protein
MTTSRKIITAIGAVVIVGLIALIVLTKVLVTPDRIKGLLLPRIEKALSRQVEIEQIDISLFSGIVLKNIAVMERQGNVAFLAAEKMTLRYRFWPLFRMRVEIDEISIDKPQIRLERLADGRFNFSDLVPAADQKSAAEQEAPVQAAADATDSDIKLLISQIAVHQGTIQFVDQLIAAGPLRYQLDDLALQVTRFSLNTDFPAQLSATLNGAPLSVDGVFDLAKASAGAKVVLSGLDVMPFAPYFRNQLPGRLEQAQIDLDLQLSSQPKQLASEGRVLLQHVDLQLDAMPQAPLKGAKIEADYNLRFDSESQKLIIDHGRLALNEIPLYISGEIHQAPEKSLNLNLRLNELNMAKAMAALPAGLVKNLVPMDPAGLITARVHLEGVVERPKALLRDGELRLDGVQAKVGTFKPELTGLVTIKGDSLLTENLVLVIDDNRLQLDCEAHSIMKMPVVAVVNVRSDRLLIDQLLPAKASSTVSAPAGSGAGSLPSQKAKQLNLPITLSGTAEIKQALYRGLAIDGLQARYRLENNLFQLEGLTGQVAGGSFKKTASIDLGRPGFAYRVQLNTRGIQADPLLTAFAPKAAGTVFGLLNLDLDLAGQGTELKVLRKQLSGQGELLLQEGRLTGSNLVKGLSDFLGLPELSVMGFDQANGSFAINQGRVDLTSTVVSQDLRLAPRGDVGLDGTLNLALDLRLSPDLTAKLDGSGRFTQLLVDADGWGQVPLKIKGSLTRPSFALDSSVIKGALKKKAEQKLQETLQKKLFGKEGPVEEGDPQEKEKEKENEKKLLEGVIKGLFGQ